MEELALKIDHVYKEYRLGTISGGTLRAELQSRFAKMRKKEDPNLKIGQVAYEKNQKFLALNDISLEIKKGETIGIIGHNGAGKSTLLKLICRVTAPTKGDIYINGRITSMLEVGTGFHDELTGRENIYLNGTILGMTKAEIDQVYDEIVEFSEIGKFIDTPVKRYSSGMKVKLGFSVASHLQSEIVIMDEVLAVGDVNFQNKCINRMKQLAQEDGRTILYVSHNMMTVKSLCERCIVLDGGRTAFVGDVEKAIAVYVKNDKLDGTTFFDITDIVRSTKCNLQHKLLSVEMIGVNDSRIQYGSCLRFKMKWNSQIDNDHVKEKMLITLIDSTPVGLILLGEVKPQKGINEREFILDTNFLVPGSYTVDNIFYYEDKDGGAQYCDRCSCMRFEILHNEKSIQLRHWRKDWGNAVLPCIKKVNE